MLTVTDLALAYGDMQALDGVTLTVPEREITAIVGANGAGKTSLIRAIAGIHQPKRGQILYRGQDITHWPSHRTVNLGIGQVAEGRQLFPSLTVRENLSLGAAIPRGRAKATETLERVFALFPRLKERERQLAGTLSGGEQQMVAIGRCLMGQPDLILFDEPSLGLAPTVVQDVFRIIRALAGDGMTIVLVEQNVRASLAIAATAYVLETGRVVLSGTGAALLADERVRQAYLGG